MFHSLFRRSSLIGLALFLITGDSFCISPGTVASRFTINGTIKSAETGEFPIGATVVARELPGVGAASNAHGYYSLTIAAGTYTFNIQYLGYSVLVDTIVLNHDQTRNFVLTPEPIREGEIVVSGEQTNSNVTSTETSANTLTNHEIETLPASLGEYDRMNAYAIYFRQNRTDPQKTEAVQIALFPIIPSITYNYKL